MRINPPDTDAGYRDLLAVAPLAPAAILLPKVSSAEEVRFVAWTLERLEEIHNLPAGQIQIMCMIESAAGVLNAAEIAACNRRVVALIFGATDFSMEVGCTITEDGRSLLAAASRIILAARAAGIDTIDTPHMKLDDAEGLARSSQLARELGFDGKSAIHPAQVGPINAAFSPTAGQVGLGAPRAGLGAGRRHHPAGRSGAGRPIDRGAAPAAGGAHPGSGGAAMIQNLTLIAGCLPAAYQTSSCSGVRPTRVMASRGDTGSSWKRR